MPSTIGCGGSDDAAARDREEGQSDFQSAPPVGQGGSFGGSSSGGTSGDAAGKGEAAPNSPAPARTEGQKTVKETDIYRVEGNRLYFLNAYRGLMVFDVTNVDQPKLLGRSPVYGTPVEMFVQDGFATVVIGDWYGNTLDGKPFHGSVVRGIDARDPANMKVAGETLVKGWARDMRVVESTLGTNLYIVSEDYGWSYGYWGYGGYGRGEGDAVGAPAGGGYYGYGGNASVVISSVSIARGQVALKGTKQFDGYSGAFNVTKNGILVAHDVLADAGQGQGKRPTGKAQLELIDISSFDGQIVPKGSLEVNGLLQGWSADNGRWNIDFDGTKAAIITCAGTDYGYCNGQAGYNLTTADFTNPMAPVKTAELAVPNSGWAITARFAGGRMYVSPREGYYANNGQNTTPIQVYDLSNPAQPKLAGQTNITGAVWMFLPAGENRMFALGNEYGSNYSSSDVSLRYLDVTDAANPKVIGTSKFGQGWAWTPAAGTFKAFTQDATKGLVVVPFSGWSSQNYEYNNGVQLVEYTANSITTKGAARGKGWVERGVFVNNRLVSLSDQALTVVDYANRDAPKITFEQTLARNVIDAQPNGNTITQLSTDWWGNDNQTSELRVLDLANAEELKGDAALKNVQIPGTNARIFRNGDLAYVVTMKYPKYNPNNGGQYEGPTPHIQVVDLANGGAVLKGSVDLPAEQSYYWGWWGGCYYWDWYDGSSIVQVENNALAFRKVKWSYDQATGKSTNETKLFVVDIANPDAPALASTTVTPDTDGWWGNMRVVGDKLYTTHYEWVQKPGKLNDGIDHKMSEYYVKYYLDQVDLTNRAAPKVGKRINVPGILVGASETNPSNLYFVDYRWYGDNAQDEISVAEIKNDKAYLRSVTKLDGYVGRVIVKGSKAYMSTEDYVKNPDPNKPGQSFVKLHELDFTDPRKPVDKPSAPQEGWGWLVDVEGDRAIITSGWGQVGLDIYKLGPNGPVYDQFARTRGWWANAISRQNDALYLSTGYWGVQKITLKQ